MPWWGLGFVLITAGLAFFLVIWLKLLPYTVTTSIDLNSGRLSYAWQVCGITTREVIYEAPLAESIKDFRGAYPQREDWVVVCRDEHFMKSDSRASGSLEQSQFSLQNFHLNYFCGAWKQQPNPKSFSTEVRAVIAERTLTVLRETMDQQEAAMYQFYAAYKTKDFSAVSDPELIPSVEEYYESGFDDPAACYR